MSSTAEQLPLGASAGGDTRFVSEPAFDLLFSEIVAYTGSYVAHAAASHATDVLRSTKADGVEVEGSGGGNGGGEIGDRGEHEDEGVIMAPSPAAVGVGNALLPVKANKQQQGSIYSVVHNQL